MGRQASGTAGVTHPDKKMPKRGYLERKKEMGLEKTQDKSGGDKTKTGRGASSRTTNVTAVIDARIPNPLPHKRRRS